MYAIRRTPVKKNRLKTRGSHNVRSGINGQAFDESLIGVRRGHGRRHGDLDDKSLPLAIVGDERDRPLAEDGQPSLDRLKSIVDSLGPVSPGVKPDPLPYDRCAGF